MRDLSLHLLDIIQNSLAAEADKISIGITANRAKNRLSLLVLDNGKGMREKVVRQAVDPFFTTRKTRQVGLGLPLLNMNSRQAGGRLLIKSVTGRGTLVAAVFQIEHPDRPPLGDIGETITASILAGPETDYKIVLKNKNNKMRISTEEIKWQLGEVPITSFEVLTWLRGYLNDCVTSIFGGVLNEIDCRAGGNTEENT